MLLYNLLYLNLAVSWDHKSARNHSLRLAALSVKFNYLFGRSTAFRQPFSGDTLGMSLG
jgi:hypothetical protein